MHPYQKGTTFKDHAPNGARLVADHTAHRIVQLPIFEPNLCLVCRVVHFVLTYYRGSKTWVTVFTCYSGIYTT